MASSMILGNPWEVENVTAFSFLCCPECVYRCKDETSFQDHAVHHHPQSVVLFSKVPYEEESSDVQVKEEEPSTSSISLDFDDDIKLEDIKADVLQSDSKRKVYCVYCNVEFPKQSDLKIHMEEEHVDDSGNLLEVKCDECDKSFPDVRAFKKHKAGVHSIRETCPECGKVFNKNGIREHMKVAHINKSVKSFKCDQCDFSTHAHKYLKGHKMNVHEKNQQKHACDRCGAKFAYPSMLKKHMCNTIFVRKDSQGRNEIIQCPECSQELKGLQYLVTHYRKSHGKLPPGYEGKQKFMCDQCSAVFLTEVSLRNHIVSIHQNIPETFVCEQCDQTFKDAKYLIQHYKYVHKDVPPGFEDREQFMCDQCPNVYFNKWSLRHHALTKHSDKGTKTKTIKRRKSCPHCMKTFATYVNCMEHIKSKHEKDTPYKCDECHRSYGTIACLKLHKRNMHSRVKCDVCSQEICNIFMLKRHKASVHGITPTDVHQCEYCPSFFQNLTMKKKHVDTHHAGRSFDDVQLKPLEPPIMLPQL